MADKLGEQLKKYVELCELLLEEISQNIKDIQFENNGGKIHYCVDFSEIYSYVYPQNELFGLDSFLKEDFSNIKTKRIINEYILETIFSCLNRELILLDPYTIELESFIHNLKFRTVNSIFQKAGDTLNQFEEMLNEEDINPIIKLANEIKKNERKLTTKEIEHCLRFFEKHLKSLIFLMEGISIQPLRRLKMLIEKKCFVNLSHDIEVKLDIEANLNDGFANHWFETLNVARKNKRRSASFMDAVAIAIIRKVNDLLKDSGTKIILITQSKNMHKIFTDQLEDGLWDNYGGNILRHPRCFSPYHYPIKGNKLVDLELLHRRKEYLEFFVESVRNDKVEGKYDSLANEKELQNLLTEVINKLKTDWIRAEAFYASISESTKYVSGEKSSTEKRVYEILSLLNNTEEIRDLITKFIDEMELIFEKGNEFLGWVVHSGNHCAREIVDQMIMLESYPGKQVLASNKLSSFYSIQFSLEKLRDIMDDMGKQWEISWQDLVRLFREGLRTEIGDNYERLLAMSFTLSVLGKWELARKYCEKALTEGKKEMGITLHEGYYFLAVCFRRTAQLPSEYKKSLELLQEAQNIKKKIKNQPHYEDLRYLAERASVIYYWNKYIEKENGKSGRDVAEEKAPNIKVFLDICKRILEKEFDDRRLWVRIVNNLCFYYADEGGEEEKKEARILLNELKEYYLSVQPDETRWSPSVIDTVVWASFKLNQPELNFKELRNSLERLNTLLRRPDVPVDDKYVINEHIQAIRSEIEKKRSKPNFAQHHHGRSHNEQK